MAKRKTPKIKDLRPEKITDEQLKKIQNTVNGINRAQMEIGQVETRKHELLHGIAGFRDQLTILQTEFEKEYGSVDINIENGIINYPDNGKTDKKD